MSAADSLQPRQFASHTELAGMYSGDYDEPMTKVLGSMREGYREHQRGEAYEDPHPSHLEHGGPDNAVRALTEDVRKNGMREPITVRNGNVIVSGHHRALAAMKLRMPQVPVRHIR